MNDNNKMNKRYLGIELGSTRIKVVLIDENLKPVATGSSAWENRLIDGYWSYDLDLVWDKIREAYGEMAAQYKSLTKKSLSKVNAIGISGMMHGYLPFDKNDQLLTGFRTWRNNKQLHASQALTQLFDYPVPQRWSIAHFYQAMLNQEEHVSKVYALNTLAGYVHWKLTGKRVIGIGEASGMFPIDSHTKNYNIEMMSKFNTKAEEIGYQVNIEEILPIVQVAGETAGYLTNEGAKLIDPSGCLEGNIPMCPPEGDAATGMVATNSVKTKTGNISAGTSIFAMIVLEKNLKKRHSEIDMVTTPTGNPVAMVHVNNGTSDLNGWVELLGEAAKLLGADFSINTLYEQLYKESLKGEKDCDGLLAYNYISGEHITDFESGRPLFVRRPDSRFTLANFMKAHLYASMAVLRIGLDILTVDEAIHVSEITGHGGLFKTPIVGQRYMAGATNIPVTVMNHAGEGGPWGMALLASYVEKKEAYPDISQFLEDEVFSDVDKRIMYPCDADVAGFRKYLKAYKKGICIERRAVDNM
ncbi:xylulokinase [Vallitalea pronyensis]|nr:FGGY-family carbohydrate kinase [Vallitalea pronyensis]